MATEEIMKWQVQDEHTAWFDLEFNKDITFKEFLTDILSRYDNSGTIYIRNLTPDGEFEYETMLYSRGCVTWLSNDIFDRINDYQVVWGEAHGFPTNIDYHIEVAQ